MRPSKLDGLGAKPMVEQILGGSGDYHIRISWGPTVLGVGGGEQDAILLWRTTSRYSSWYVDYHIQITWRPKQRRAQHVVELSWLKHT